MKRALLATSLIIPAAFGLNNLWIKVGYGAVVLVALFVLYKLIRTTEEEEKTLSKATGLPWNEMKAITKKGNRISKKKIEIEDAYDNAKIIKWNEGDKIYD